MLRIRLQRTGRRNDPSYRVVVVESAVAAKKGVPVEILGFHDTVRKKSSINGERVLHWISNGAKPSDTMHNILIASGIIEGTKYNVLPKKRPIVKNEDGGEEAAPENEDKKEDGAAPNEQEEAHDDSAPQQEDTDIPSPEG